MWNASWIARGISRGSWIRIECLTIGIVMPLISASWKPSVPISSVRTWPVRKTVGTLSITASAIGVTVGRPGPDVASATPTVRGLGVALRRVPSSLLVAALDVADAGVVEGVVGRQIGPAGNSEHVLDALGLEALHDGVDGAHGTRAPFRSEGAARARAAKIESTSGFSAPVRYSRSRPQRMQT